MSDIERLRRLYDEDPTDELLSLIDREVVRTGNVDLLPDKFKEYVMETLVNKCCAQEIILKHEVIRGSDLVGAYREIYDYIADCCCEMSMSCLRAINEFCKDAPQDAKLYLEAGRKWTEIDISGYRYVDTLEMKLCIEEVPSKEVLWEQNKSDQLQETNKRIKKREKKAERKLNAQKRAEERRIKKEKEELALFKKLKKKFEGNKEETP